MMEYIARESPLCIRSGVGVIRWIFGMSVRALQCGYWGWIEPRFDPESEL